MKVLLFEDVENLGWLGDIVTVKDGYARNYLVPQGLAGVPTEANIKLLADEKARRAEQRKLQRQQQEELAEKVTGAEVVVAAKANELGHLFGLNHVADIHDLMDSTGSASTLLGDQEFLTDSPLESNVFPIGIQDSMLWLLETLGPDF